MRPKQIFLVDRSPVRSVKFGRALYKPTEDIANSQGPLPATCPISSQKQTLSPVTAHGRKVPIVLKKSVEVRIEQ
jgi:hypothetical protein